MTLDSKGPGCLCFQATLLSAKAGGALCHYKYKEHAQQQQKIAYRTALDTKAESAYGNIYKTRMAIYIRRAVQFQRRGVGRWPGAPAAALVGFFFLKRYAWRWGLAVARAVRASGLQSGKCTVGCWGGPLV